VCLERRFSIGAKNVYWLDDRLVHILDELFDGFGEDLPLGGGECALVGRECLDSLYTFGLLEFAAYRLATASTPIKATNYQT
jgi:hypothetical protein